MEKQSIVAADALISPTNFLVNEIQKYISLAGKNIGIIANPYKTDLVKSSEFIRNKIIYYGKLSSQKGTFELLANFRELWDNGFQYPLQIIGGMDIVYHPEMKTMEQLVREKYAAYLKNGLLQLDGKIQPSEINKFIRKAHVIIVPSIVDNMPYVVMEAMSLCKIVLASKQGGQQEMLEEGVTGFLFDHNVPNTFGEQLNKILSLDDATVQNIGAKASQRIENAYSFEKIKSEKIHFLEKAKVNITAKNGFPFLYQERIMPVFETTVVKDLLSIVIPFYDMGNYIEECVRSIFESSYKNIELLIINDGSTDSLSIEKLHKLSQQKNVTIINRSNKGLAETRNHGAEIAKGEFLAFLDADDKVDSTYFEKAIKALKLNNNVFFAGAWVRYFENSTTVWPTFTPQPPYALVHNPVNSSGLVYKRKAFLAAGKNDRKVDYGMEDYESLINMLSKGFNGIVLAEVLFFYRVRTGSMFRDVSKEKLLYSNKFISEKHERYYTKFAIQIINLLNANGPGYLYDNPTFKLNVSTKSASVNILFFKLKNFIKKNERLKKIALTLKNTKSPL
jgi:glycosyltransferase involved in cell wall biosynthesis